MDRPPTPGPADPAPLVEPAAAIVLIGDELLSGKVRDENGWFLVGALRRRGIEVREISVVGDDLTAIGSALWRAVARAPIVFTAGGVGPTHDDVTMRALAAALDRPMTRHARMEAMLRGYYGARLTEESLRMADVPEGTELVASDGWPVFRLKAGPDACTPQPATIYVLPGIPRLVQAKFAALEAVPGELPVGPAWTLSWLLVSLDENALAAPLDEVVRAFPDVAVGSYPQESVRDARGLSPRVRLTFEGRGDAAAQARLASQALAQRLGDHVVDRG